MSGLLNWLGLRWRCLGGEFIRRLIGMSQLTLLHRTRVSGLVKLSLTVLTIIRPKIPLINQFPVVVQNPYDLFFLFLVHLSV